MIQTKKLNNEALLYIRNAMRESNLSKLMTGDRKKATAMAYSSELKAIAKEIVSNKDLFEQFQQSVVHFTGAIGKNEDVATFYRFKERYVSQRGTEVPDKGLKDYGIPYFKFKGESRTDGKIVRIKNNNVQLNNLFELYVYTFSAEIIAEYNRNVIIASSEAMKHGEKLHISTITNITPNSILGVTNVASATVNKTDTAFVSVLTKTKPSYWTRIENNADIKNMHKIILSKRRIKASIFANRDITFIHSLYRAMNKVDWTDAAVLVNYMVRNGLYRDILDSYNESNVDVFYYYKNNEHTGNQGGSEDSLIKSLVSKLIDIESINLKKERNLKDVLIKYGYIEDKKEVNK